MLSRPLDNKDTINFFLTNFSYNFGRIEQVDFLAAGGENVVYRVNPFIPIEIIAKATLSKTEFNEIMLENHFLRLAHNDKYICKVLEEIIALSGETKKILYLIAIIESAENDLMTMAKVWCNPEL